MKTVYGLKVENLKLLPERMVKDAAELNIERDPDNSFTRLLKSAEEFRDAGLTPVFFCDADMQKVMVTTKEKIERKFH
jgi:hypothetical protein